MRPTDRTSVSVAQNVHAVRPHLRRQLASLPPQLLNDRALERRRAVFDEPRCIPHLVVEAVIRPQLNGTHPMMSGISSVEQVYDVPHAAARPIARRVEPYDDVHQVATTIRAASTLSERRAILVPPQLEERKGKKTLTIIATLALAVEQV